jgi:hypothetical protein
VRVGLLTTSYPRHAGDYAGCFVADRVALLLAAGHSVEVLAAGDDGAAKTGGRPRSAPVSARGWDRSARERDFVAHSAGQGLGLAMTRLPAGLGLFYGSGAPEALEVGGATWLAAARFSTALAATARRRATSWDTVESHWLVPCALAASAAAPALSRRAYAHSGDVALLERIPFGRALARRLAGDGTRLHFVSGELQSRFARLCGRSVGVVEALPVPSSLFPRRTRPDSDLRRRLGLSAPTVLAVGRLVPIKGHQLLLHACARIADGAPPRQRPQVVILGDGPERESLIQLAARLGVPLRLPGFVPRAEVADWLRAADVYVQPSIRLPNGRTEGAPIATREAVAIGVPLVVASQVETLSSAIREQLCRRNQNVNTV